MRPRHDREGRREAIVRGRVRGSHQSEQISIESFGMPVNKGSQGLRGGLVRALVRALGLFKQGGHRSIHKFGFRVGSD